MFLKNVNRTIKTHAGDPFDGAPREDLMRVKAAVFLSFVMVPALLAGSPALAQNAAAFFKGREVKLIVGTGAGGGYDTYARLTARFLPKHMPGNPLFVVQTMPGASGVKAVNYLYAAAPKDGSVIATFNNSMAVYQALGQPGIQFKCEELSWIGSLSEVVNTIAVWHTAGVRTIEDAKQKEIIMGATGAGGTMATYPALLNGALGTRFKIVTGYEAGHQVDMAMERGEVQGRGSNPWASYKAVRPDWVRDGKIVPLVQVGMTKDADLPHVPRLVDLATNDEQRRMFEFVSTDVAMERPYAGPPGMPADRLQAYRRGFEQMTKDPEFLAVVKQQDLDINLHTGEEVEKMVRHTTSTPPEIIAKVKEAVALKDAARRSGAAQGAGE
jgi:tripartite-type tricarboxylate transporter receptor subunit TctC